MSVGARMAAGGRTVSRWNTLEYERTYQLKVWVGCDQQRSSSGPCHAHKLSVCEALYQWGWRCRRCRGCCSSFLTHS